ncbi:MAG: helix-turn-helix domain-containing protein [Planctomycetota bacterium]
MDKNKTQTILPEEISPSVSVANYITVAHGGWPQHDVPDPELILLIHGELVPQDGEHEPTPLHPGDVVLIRPGFPCNLTIPNPGRTVVSCIHFEPMAGKRFADGDYTLGPDLPWVIRCGGRWEITDLFRRCAAEFGGYSPYRSGLLTAMMAELWMRLMAIHTGQATSRSSGGRLNAMQAFIRDHLKRGVTRHDLAEEFALTPEHINHLFRTQLGLTPTRFLNRERCLKASNLLAEGRLNVNQTARAVGFQDPLYFSRLFRRELGFPPSQLLGQRSPRV